MEHWIVLTKYYEPKLVLLSIIVAIIGSYASLELNRRLAQTVGMRKRALLVSSLTMGIAIWGMHFLGMGAFRLPVMIHYDWTLMLLSLLPAIVAAWIAFYVLHHSERKRLKVALAGTLMGIGIALMHYMGMSAMDFGGEIRYDRIYFTLSVLIAVSVSYIALMLFHLLRNVRRKIVLMPVAGLMGLSISLMHYTGMYGSSFCLPDEAAGRIGDGPVVSNILGNVAIPAFLTFLVITVLYVRFERRALQIMAFTDHLTGLHNRRWLDHNMERYDTTYDRSGHQLDMYLVDLDGYKWVNDAFGFDQGDTVVQEMAARLKETLGLHEACIRYNGTQFFLIKRIKEDAEREEFLKSLLDVIRKPIHLTGQEIYLTATIGVVTAPKKEALETRISRLESALRAGKLEGRDRYVIYEETKHSEQREQQIVGSLRRAMRDFAEFRLLYQPKVALATGKVEQAEVLIRWNHPKLGFISPAEFIPLAEKYGLIHRLTEWVLEQTAEQLIAWRKESHFIRNVAVNLSATHFRSESHNLMIRNVIERYQGEEESLHFQLEITETSVMENLDRALLMLGELKQLSFSIALDDFGTGLSSLTHLKHLPIDTLKIDKSFIDEVPHDQQGSAITELIIQLAKNLGIEVVAEGVETQEQHDFLRKLGCDYGQGYFYSRPVNARDLNQHHIERQASGE